MREGVRWGYGVGGYECECDKSTCFSLLRVSVLVWINKLRISYERVEG